MTDTTDSNLRSKPAGGRKESSRAAHGSAIRVVELRRRLAEEIGKERRAMLASRDGTMSNSGDFFMGRIAALVALGRAYPKDRESPNDRKLSDGGAWRGACPTVERTNDAQM